MTAPVLGIDDNALVRAGPGHDGYRGNRLGGASGLVPATGD
jgi:hypothetical protein